MSETRDYRRHDLTGQRFGRLVKMAIVKKTL